MVFNAPQPVPGLPQAHLQSCDDKAVNHSYPQPCSSWRNCRLNFVNRPNHQGENSLSPDGNPVDFNSRHCRNQAEHRADEDTSTSEDGGSSVEDEDGGIFHVCRYCIASTEYEQWFKLANTYFMKKPKLQAKTNRSRHFLTRLCRLCEVREETLLGHIQNNAPALRVMNLPTPAQRGLMANWPQNRCTCVRTALYDGIRCGTHRRPQWNRERPIFLARKARKKNFLINIEQDAHGQRIPSTPATQMRRRLNGLWRACRCGADPVATTDAAVVMQCMGCEGIVHVPPGGTQPAVINPLPYQRRQNSITTPGLFVLP